MARIAASAAARTLSQARASLASTLIEKNTLPSLAVIGDSTLAWVRATPRGVATLASASWTCCWVTATGHLLNLRQRPVAQFSQEGYRAPTSSVRIVGAAPLCSLAAS